MKLRLTASGFETFEGQMGVLFFEQGLSTSDVHPNEARRIAAVIGAEWEDGSPANIGAIYALNANTAAPTQEQMDAEKGASAQDAENASAVQAAAAVYTEDQLATVADKKGIAGLREIAEPLGIKAQSIRALIDGILKAGAKAE